MYCGKGVGRVKEHSRFLSRTLPLIKRHIKIKTRVLIKNLSSTITFQICITNDEHTYISKSVADVELRLLFVQSNLIFGLKFLIQNTTNTTH